MIGPGEPEWLPEDTEAALEWMEHQRTLCPGCGHPRHETFNPENEDRYDVTVLQCHACAARERKAYNRSAGRDADQAPPFGEFFAVTGPTDD